MSAVHPLLTFSTCLCGSAGGHILHDPLSLAAQAWLVVTPGEMSNVVSRAAAAATAMANAERDPVRALVQKVRLLRGRIEIDMATRALADLLQVPIASEAPVAITLASELRLTRTGRAVRLIQNNGAALGGDRPDPTLVKLVAKARTWWSELRAGDVDVPTLARREGVTQSYISRVTRLAFLSPSVVDAILTGSQLAAVRGGTLTAPAAIPISWIEQRAIFQTKQLAGS